MKTTSANVEDTYANIVARSIPIKNERSNSKNEDKYDDHNIKKKFRIQGVPEDVEKSRGENLVPTTEKIDDVLKTIGVQPQIVGMKRLGKFSKERAKPRTLLVTVSTEHEARMILAKSFENRDKFVTENVYLTYALTKEEALKESLCLKRSRELLNDGVPREKLNIRNFELFSSNVRVDLKSNDFVGPETSS